LLRREGCSRRAEAWQGSLQTLGCPRHIPWAGLSKRASLPGRGR
jgi:hypothetical protein